MLHEVGGNQPIHIIHRRVARKRAEEADVHVRIDRPMQLFIQQTAVFP